MQVERWVEKPTPADAPSRMAICARYVFTPGIFPLLRQTQSGKNGEIQLTDAMAQLAKQEAMFGVKIAGKRFDIGNKIDFVKTNIHFALEHPDTKEAITEYIQSLDIPHRPEAAATQREK